MVLVVRLLVVLLVVLFVLFCYVVEIAFFCRVHTTVLTFLLTVVAGGV